MAVGVDYSLFYLRREREERARGPVAARGAAERGRHLRPRRLHLGPDRADRDGGHALHRQRRLHVDRRRRDADGRGRADRLALDPARAAVEARAPRRHGTDSRSSAGAAAASRGSGASCSTASCAGRRSSAVLSGGALLALALPTLTLHTQLPSFTDLPQSLPIVRTYESIQRAFPGAQTPAKVVIAADDVTAPHVQHGDRGAEAAGARDAGRCSSRSRPGQPGPHRRDGVDLAAGRRQRTARRWPRCRRSATA